jgi:hypothetical protein
LGHEPNIADDDPRAPSGLSIVGVIALNAGTAGAAFSPG